MLNPTNKIKKIILFTGDLFILYVSLYITLNIRYGFPPEYGTLEKHIIPFSIVFLMWIIIFYIIGLYDRNLQQNTLVFYSLIGKSIIFCGISATIFFYFIPDIGISPKRVLFINLLVFTAMFYIWRKLYNHILRSSMVSNHILFAGINNRTMEIVNKIFKNPQLGYRISTIIIDNKKYTDKIPGNINVVPSDNFNLLKIIKDEKIQIIVTSDEKLNDKIARQLYKRQKNNINLLSITDFYEELTGKIPVNLINETWFLKNLNENRKKLYETSKRIFDIIFSIICIIISIPILPIVSMAIKIDSSGPVFFSQIRSGKNGKKFLAIKLRTMKKDAEKNGPEWAKINDSRITRIGGFLRKTRIDEIPQLFNVLRGEMSFIGPRPERPEFIKTLEENIPFYSQRMIIKPGLTGWAQINFPYGASIEDGMEKMQYDLFYIKNRSFILDLSIILKTINTVLRGGGR